MRVSRWYKPKPQYKSDSAIMIEARESTLRQLAEGKDTPGTRAIRSKLLKVIEEDAPND